ncbi:MAG: TIGR03013 family PEP-CTERM/XrtA system glycosyltransferase [Desulfovibrionales bacterium]|nr:TIGR03013 family PEP-CTERM/XrtA system glycosyltransferase [Desulfovibrionales bacterium]
MATIVLRNLAQDIIWAVLALAVSLGVLTPSLFPFVGDGEALREAYGFLLITVVPSVIMWSLFGVRGLKSQVPAALFCQVIVTSLSMAMMFMMQPLPWMSGEEQEVVLFGLGVFGVLKISEFLFWKYRLAIPGLIKRVLVVGDGPLADQMETLARSRPARFALLGRVPCPSTLLSDGGQQEKGGDAGRLLRMAQNFMVDYVVVSLTERRGFFPVAELLACKLAGIEVLDAPTFYERTQHKLLIENITPSWFIFSHGFRVTWFLRLIKRTMDIVLSVLGLLFFLPVLPIVAVAIKLDSPGPVLFRQVRVGQGDRPFTVLKFRTMRLNAESESGAVWCQKEDSRITRVGHVLRKTRLDEVPQLLNILKGDMSIVGPRPERPEFVENLKEIIPYYSERHYVKPGLSGWAQVSYPYGSSVEDAVEKLRYDLYYIKNISVTFDIYVIFRTIKVVLLGKGR